MVPRLPRRRLPRLKHRTFARLVPSEKPSASCKPMHTAGVMEWCAPRRGTRRVSMPHATLAAAVRDPVSRTMWTRHTRVTRGFRLGVVVGLGLWVGHWYRLAAPRRAWGEKENREASARERRVESGDWREKYPIAVVHGKS